MTKNNNVLRTQRKRLYFDLECSANVGLFWTSGYKLNIGTENIIKERAVICICYKWEDDKDVYYLQWDSKQCDKKILQDFIKVANEADELIGHNGDKFDLAWIRTRCLFHRIDMFPTYNTIDTLKIARSKFRFNSNRLDYIGKFLGLGQKNHTNFDLWKDIMLKNCKKSMNIMIDYCIQDVVLLEQVHKELNNHIPAKTHYGVIFGGDRGSCPECGSDELVKNNRRVMASGLVKIQYKCQTCGKMHSKTDK
jgi:DNA polymerase elongation subunit (family B)/DNA-directed RNA polymerase subunit RPC12/RpoP